MANITFVGTGVATAGTFAAGGADWNTGTNWSGGMVPTGADTAVLPGGTAAANVILSGGSYTVANVAIDSENLFVGATGDFGGTGAGNLTATGTISVVNGYNLVSVAGSTITATGGFSIGSGVEMGGGGTFNGPIINAGTVRADGNDFALGAMIVNASTIAGPGTIDILAGSTLELNAPTSQLLHIDNSHGTILGTATLELDQPATFAGPLVIGAGDTLDLFLQGQTISGATINSGGTLVVSEGGTTESFILQGGSYAVSPATSSLPGYAELTLGVVCFARGTRIATSTGPVAVENLTAGDGVVTARGESQRITWIGRRRVDCRRHPEPHKVWPIRIRAGAFAPGVPERDLRVSPQHAIFDEGVLIPARFLVNGSTVTQEHAASVEYFHVELERHDILLAEGLPAESYLDTGDRATFENAAGAIVLHPDFARWAWDGQACAELKVIGPELDAVRAKLAQRVEAIAEQVSIAS